MNLLILSIGSNPMPNFITAKYLLGQNEIGEIPDTVLFVFSSHTEKFKNAIIKQLESDVQIELISLEDKTREFDYIKEKVLKKLEELNNIESIHLNYTGGTKPMAVGILSAVEKFNCKNTIYSDLSPDKFKLTLRNGNEFPTRKNIRDFVKINVEDIYALHDLNKPALNRDKSKWYSDKFIDFLINKNLEHINKNRSEFFDEYWSLYPGHAKETKNRSQLKKEIQYEKIIADINEETELNKNKKCKKTTDFFTAELKKMREFMKNSIADFKNPCSDDELNSIKGFVCGTWLEEYLFSVLTEIKHDCKITDLAWNVEIKNKPFKLTAVYPQEGNFRTQHPAAVLKEAWMTPDKESACRKFIEFLISPEAQHRAMEMGLRPILKKIEMSSPFDAEHGVNPNLASGKTFKVPPENVLKRIRNLWEEVKAPATIILVLDRSGSMKGSPMDNAKAGAIEFIRSMKPRDQLMITVFGDNVTVLAELCTIRQCGEDVTGRLNNVFAIGKTSLYDALAQTYKQLRHFKQQQPDRRYSILLLSDGKDTSSKLKRHDFLDLLPGGEDFDAPKIYTIAYGSKADQDLLAEIANRTNARLFTSSPEEIRKTYKELSANF